MVNPFCVEKKSGRGPLYVCMGSLLYIMELFAKARRRDYCGPVCYSCELLQYLRVGSY